MHRVLGTRICSISKLIKCLIVIFRIAGVPILCDSFVYFTVFKRAGRKIDLTTDVFRCLHVPHKSTLLVRLASVIL